MTREIELSLAKADHVEFDRIRKAVTWRLPATKTDPKAFGCPRTWGCTCLQGEINPCAYCALGDQHRELVCTFGMNDGSLPRDLPLLYSRPSAAPLLISVWWLRRSTSWPET